MRTESDMKMHGSIVPGLASLVKKSRWRETLLLATKRFEHRLAAAGRAADSLQEDDTLGESGVPAEVKDELKQVWAALLSAQDAVAPVMRLLSKLGDWEGVLTVTGPALHPEAGRLRANALRSLGRQDEALTELEQVPFDPADTKLLRLRAALLCDIGDFESALSLLVPATEPMEKAQESLLTLRGWAHQNCDGNAHATQAEHVYRHALDHDPEDHWSRKGLANALRRLGRLDEAKVEYERVVAYAREQREKKELDPYDACLAGWCCYCLDNPKEGAAFSSTGLAVIGVGAAAQFDYALMLLADLQVDAARDQFELSIEGLSGKNPLRRCGLLYVALTDLGDAISHHPALAKTPESYLIQKELTKALEQALLDFGEDRWTNLRDKMRAFLNKVHQEDHLAEVELLRRLGGNPEEIDWSEMEVRGFVNDAPKKPIALFLPLISHKRLPKVLYRISESNQLTAVLENVEDQGLWNQESGTLLFAKSYPAFLTSRVLWVAEEVVEAFDSNAMSLEEPLRLPFDQGGAWEEVSMPAPARAAVSERGPAEVLLDDLGRQFASKAVEQLMQHFKQYGEETCPHAVRLAEYAVAAAVSERTLHAALLAFGAAGGTIQSPQLASIQRNVSFKMVDDFAALERDVEDFRKRSLWRAQMTSLRSHESAEPGNPTVMEDEYMLSPSSKLRKSILSRARSIAEVPDENEQNRLAAEAATEMQSMIPVSGGLEDLRCRLAQEMNSKDNVYLENDDIVLLMSREPAFYAPRVLLKTDPPSVHTFNFLTQTRRMQQAGIPLPSETLFVA